MMSGPMKALLAVLAVAGYQNRDKIGELLRGIQNPSRPARETSSRAGLGAFSVDWPVRADLAAFSVA